MNLLCSEWTKFRSLRSTWLTAVVTLVLGVGVGVLSASAQAREGVGPDWDPAAASLTSIIVAQLAIGVLGVLVMTAEYATGTIQPSVVAAPRRGRLLTAKVAVLSAAAVVLGQMIGFASFFAGQALIASAGAPHATLGQPDVLRAVVGSGLYLAALGVLGLGLGAVLRSTAGAIGTLVAVTLVVRLVAQTLPESVREWMSSYWPTAAGESIATVVPVPGALGPWQGFAVLCGFVAAVCAAGYATFRSRDT